jgi:tetratricopeptide (TPR) repeat protein
MVNYQPKLEGPTRTQQRDWVFLFESSGDRNPLVARVQIDVIRHLLRHAEPADRFAVLTAGSRVRGFGKELQAVTPENVQAALNFLEGSHLIGALDLAQALTEAQALLKQAKNPHLVHVGSGIPAMGERRDDQLIKLVPAGTRYVGVGVGRRWNRSLMKAAAERSGGLFTQINPDEPVGWRAFDLFASLNTPRLFNAQVTAEGCPPFLVFDPSVSEGEELAAVTRLGPGQDLPANITVRGTVNGKPFERIVPVKNVALHADYLPRSWARLEIDRLLIEEPVKNKDAIIALSKAMYVMTPYTSLLVLENEDLYTQYKVDRGRKDHWAMYPAPARIDIVYEPEPGMEGKDRKLARTAKQVLDTVVVRTSKGGKTPREPDVIALGVTDMPPERRPFIAGLPPAGETPSLAVFGRPAREVPDGGIAINGGLAERTSFRESERLEVLRKRLADSIHEQRIVTSRIVRSDEKQLARLATAVDDSLSMSLELGLQSATKLKLASKDRAEAGYGLRGFGTRLDGNALAGARGEPGRPLGRKLSKAIDDLGNGIFENLKTPEAVDVYAGELVKSSRTRPSLLYQRPTFRGEDRYFFDLASYAPGMNTSVADIYATIEREATLGPLPKPGLIDGSARDLLDRARVTTWHAWQLPDESGQPGYTIYFDGQGRYSYERTLPFGLKERVVCDGDTLLHLYPQLYLAARRSVSRFHRSAFFNFVPWALPKAEDLARDADLKVVADRTVAVVPHGIEEWKDKDGKPLPYHRLHFVFAANGPLAERQIVRMPAGEIIAREVYSEDGIIRVLDDKGKELVVQKGTLRKAAAPSLSPDTSKLVVVPLPFRTRDHVVRQLKVEKKGTRDLMLSQALPVLTADFGSGDRAHAQSVFREVFAARDQRQLGLYVLLASIGQNLDAENEDVLGEHPEEALSQYLALHTSSVLRKHATQWAATSRPWNDPFLQHLANTHALYQRWSSDRALKGTPAKVREDRLRAMAYVEANRTSLFGWGLLCLLQDRAGKDEPFNREIAESFRLFDDMASLRYAAQYEHARSLYRGGETGKARERFVKLYTATLDEDVLPSIDSEFRKALLGKGEESDLWSELIHKTAHRLIQHKHRAAVIALAWQCWQLDDQPLANQLLLTALEGVKDEQERTALTMAAIDFLMHSSQLVQADQLLQGLLQDAKLAERPSLWRLAASLAERRDLPDRALDCLETALDREVRKLPEVIDLQVVRAEYGKVLQHYQKLAEAMVTLKVQPPPNFVAKVVRAVDRWRALDPESADACHTAARILQRLGQKDLGWDYLTTPIAFRPAEAGPWLSLAQTLGRQGDLLLADRAYKAAYEAEPTNAQILWDRAVNLRQAGKTVEAQALFRQIAEGTWQPRFQGLRSQAKLQLQGS